MTRQNSSVQTIRDAVHSFVSGADMRRDNANARKVADELREFLDLIDTQFQGNKYGNNLVTHAHWLTERLGNYVIEAGPIYEEAQQAVSKAQEIIDVQQETIEQQRHQITELEATVEDYAEFARDLNGQLETQGDAADEALNKVVYMVAGYMASRTGIDFDEAINMLVDYLAPEQTEQEDDVA